MSQATEARPRRVGARLRTAPALVVAIAIALFVGGFGGYALSQHRSGVRELTDNAYVGDHQVSVEVGGWTYGFAQSVPWIDAAGTHHESGWPSCLAPIGAKVPIRFGETPVTQPDGFGTREVVWVDCRG